MLGNGQTIYPIRCGKIPPWNHAPWDVSVARDSNLSYEYEQLSPKKLGHQTRTVSASAPFPINYTDFEGSLNVLEHLCPKRGLFIVVLMVLNQTMCPYLWEILDTVALTTKWLSLTPPASTNTNVMFTDPDLNQPRRQNWPEPPTVPCRVLGWISPSETIAISPHAHRQHHTYSCNIYVYIENIYLQLPLIGT